MRQTGGVRRAFLLSIMFAAGLLGGCQKSSPLPVTVDANPLATLPTQAQPRLQTVKLYLGAETIEAELALTPRQIQTGMMFRTNIPETDTMLFNLQIPQRANFWMKNCPESISAAYISPDGVIQEIHHLEKNDTNGVVAARDDIVFVLETKDGWFGRHNIGVGTLITSEKGPLAQVFLRRQ